MPRPRYQVWTDAEIAWLVNARANGATAGECAAHLGRTVSQVQNKIQDAQIPYRRRGLVTPPLSSPAAYPPPRIIPRRVRHRKSAH